MVKTIFFSLIIFLLASCAGSDQSREINHSLKKSLDSIYQLDQGLRSKLNTVFNDAGHHSRQADSLWKMIHEADRSNLAFVIKAIDSYGYPGRSLVGVESSEAAFFVLQHAPEEIMERYYNIIIEAGKNGELSMKRVAMFQDRVLMHNDQPQIYGTQLSINTVTDPVSGEQKTIKKIYPIQDPHLVNEKRQAIGLSSIEEYAAYCGAIYQP